MRACPLSLHSGAPKRALRRGFAPSKAPSHSTTLSHHRSPLRRSARRAIAQDRAAGPRPRFAHLGPCACSGRESASPSSDVPGPAPPSDAHRPAPSSSGTCAVVRGSRPHGPTGRGRPSCPTSRSGPCGASVSHAVRASSRSARNMAAVLSDFGTSKARAAGSLCARCGESIFVLKEPLLVQDLSHSGRKTPELTDRLLPNATCILSIENAVDVVGQVISSNNSCS